MSRRVEHVERVEAPTEAVMHERAILEAPAPPLPSDTVDPQPRDGRMGDRRRTPNRQEREVNHKANSTGCARDFDPHNPKLANEGEPMRRNQQPPQRRNTRQPQAPVPGLTSTRRDQPQTRGTEYREDPGWGNAFRREAVGNQPQYTGKILDPDGDELQIAIWVTLPRSGGQRYLRIHVEPPWTDPDDPLADDDDTPEDDLEDDVPF